MLLENPRRMKKTLVDRHHGDEGDRQDADVLNLKLPPTPQQSTMLCSFGQFIDEKS